jgi:GAF domain-containing protein
MSEFSANRSGESLSEGEPSQDRTLNIDELETLRRTTLAITQTLDRAALLQVICKQAARLLNARGAGIFENDPDAGRLVRTAAYGPSQSLVKSELKHGEGAAGKLINSREEFAITTDLKTAGGRKILEVPLTWQDRRIGILYVDDYLQRAYTHKDAQLLGMMADHVAIAIETAGQIREIERESQDREMLRRISMELSEKTDIHQVLSTLLDGGSRLLGVEMIVAHLRTDVPGKYQSFYRPARLKSLFTPPRPETGLTAKIIRTAQPIFVHDTQKDQNTNVNVNDNVIRVGVRSIAAFPLVVRGEVIGVLYFNSRKPRFFGTRELDLISLLVRHGAVAIENARSLERFERNASLNEALVRMGQMLTTHRALEKQLKTIWGFVSGSFEASSLLVSVRDPACGKMGLHRCSAAGLQEVHLQPGDACAAGYVMHTGRPLSWRTEQERVQVCQEAGIRPCEEEIGGESGLVYPLESAAGAFGTISIQSEQPYAWGELEHTAFQTLARLAAASLRNSQLIGEIQEGNMRLEAAYSASKDITSRLDPDQALEDIVRRVPEVMEAWRAMAVLIDQSGYPQLLASAGFQEDLEHTTAIRPDGLSMRVQQEKTPLYLENLQTCGLPVHPRMVDQGVQAAACLPLVYLGTCMGVLWIHYREPHIFTDSDRKSIQLYASQAAIAYENARRVRELERMQQAAEVLSSKTDLDEVLRQIVESARLVLEADSAAVWSYDSPRQKFILDESVASGIPESTWVQFRRQEPRVGQTAYTVMQSENGWVGIEDIQDAERYPFLGSSTRQLLGEVGAQSFQGLKLSVGNEILGVLYVNYNHKRGFQEENERKTALTFCNHAALVLKNAQLLQQVQSVRKTAGVVAEMTVINEELDETLNSIVRGTQEVLRCDVVTLYTYDEARDQFGFPPSMIGVNDRESVLRLDHVARETVPYKVIRLNDLHVTEDTLNDPIMCGEFTVREEVKATVGIPLMVRDHKVGVMFGNYRQPHRFTHDEVANFRSFAHQAAIAIYNAQLFERLQQRALALEALNQAGRVVTSSLELKESLNRIAEQAWQLTGQVGKRALFSAIMLTEDDKARFVAVYPPEEMGKITECLGDGIDLNTRVKGRCGVVGEVIRSGESQLIADVSKHPQYLSSHQETCSELAVPIKFNNRVIGVINVEHAEPGIFDREDQRDLESLAAHASTAIEHARQYQEVKSMKGFVGNNTALDWIRLVSLEWGHSIWRDTSTSLIKTGLIRRFLEKDRLDLVWEELELLDERLRIIQNTPITAPLSIEDAVDNVEVNSLLQSYLQRKWQVNPYNLVDLCYDLQPELDSLGSVRTSRAWLRRALEILVENAVQAMTQAGSSRRRLTVQTRLVEERIHITVADTGPGVPPEITDRICREPVPSQKGAGVGLAIAGTIADTYGGRLDLTKNGADGAVFRLQLPIVLK